MKREDSCFDLDLDQSSASSSAFSSSAASSASLLSPATSASSSDIEGSHFGSHHSLLLLLIGISILLPALNVAVPASDSIRNGRHFGFEADEMLQNAFDEAGNVFADFGKVEKKYLPFEETAKAKQEISNRTKSNDLSTTGSRENATSRGKFEFPAKERDSFANESIAERNVVLFGGAHYNVRSPGQFQTDGNNTGIKIFWTSLGEAVESIPFLPVQINVPDMISAVANFLVAHFPFINRLANQNDPRDPLKSVSIGGNQTEIKSNHQKTSSFAGESDEDANRREYRTQPDEKDEENVSAKRRKTKRKSNRKRNSSQKIRRVFQLPNIRRTTPSPNHNSNFWQSWQSDEKGLVRVKNMPIVRKKNRIADREIFNFKNSDISNSPIMILNVPHRPITQFKIIHEELKDRKMLKQQQQHRRGQQQQILDPTKYNVTIHGQFTNQNSTSRPRRKFKIGNKTKRPAGRSGQTSGSKSTGMETTTLTST